MEYDVLIIGAGINGCAIAREVSSQGKKVAVIDKAMIGSGTSSKSSRLIHGGLRYLEHGDFSLVKEALNDRTRLCERYSDLVRLRPFTLPVYRHVGRSWWMIKSALFLYDLLSKFVAPHQTISPVSFHEYNPLFKRTGLERVFVYHDASTDDLALTQRVADEAKNNGTQFFESTHITHIQHDPEFYEIHTSQEIFKTRILINSTGPWIDEVNYRFHLPARYTINKVSGIHIVIPKLLSKEALFMQTDHQRIFFILPDHDTSKTIIGTTERMEHAPTDSVMVNEEDIRYLLNETNRFLITPLTRDDVCDSYIGVRPLIHSKKSMVKTSREYQVDLHDIDQTRLIHVFGGKLTTHWSLAEKVAKLTAI